MNARELLLGSFKAAVAAADPLQIVPQHLPAPPKGRTLVIGAGKAGARAVIGLREHGWQGDITLIGDEVFPPYDRPPLSKAQIAEVAATSGLANAEVKTSDRYEQAGEVTLAFTFHFLTLALLLTLALILVPFIPGLRSIPRWSRGYRLIWRDYYRGRS